MLDLFFAKGVKVFFRAAISLLFIFKPKLDKAEDFCNYIFLIAIEDAFVIIDKGTKGKVNIERFIDAMNKSSDFISYKVIEEMRAKCRDQIQLEL